MVDKSIVIADTPLMTTQQQTAAQVSIDNGNTYYSADAVNDIDDAELTSKWDALVNMMDDEVRELVHGSKGADTHKGFLRQYLENAKCDLVLG